MIDTRAEITVREACRRRMALDGADAQALEHALTITERERDAAESEVARLRGLLGECAGWIGDTCDRVGMSDTRLNAARVLLSRLAAALEKDHG